MAIIEDWQKLDSAKAIAVLDAVNAFLSPLPLNEESTTVRSQLLPFYQGYSLAELTDMSGVPAVRKYALYKSNDVHVIDWTNQPIYDVNEKAPILLDKRRVINYVRFFFNYVRGRHGRFLIVESIDDVSWQIEPPLQGRKIMQDMLAPVSFLDQNEDGIYNLEAYMLFKDSLFKTKVHVTPEGLVNMSEEELKVEGMPVLQDRAS